jgi:hypothetical protein
MTNLEELGLQFFNIGDSIIDGDILKKYFINHMPRLNKFTFNIGSLVRFNNLRNLPSNVYIQNTFRNFQNNRIISSVYYFSTRELLYCHVYSYPYTWNFYHNITNDFSGGLFKCVRTISLRDERPFEHDFLFLIAKSFPFITKLSLQNYEPQQNNHLQWPMIKYHHLIEIDLVKTHQDYVEEFLNNTKICLTDNVHLRVQYKLLKTQTNNFTRDTTQMNCAKIITLTLADDVKDFDDNFQKYFPRAQIHSSL